MNTRLCWERLAERELHIRAEKSDKASLYCWMCATKMFCSTDSEKKTEKNWKKHLKGHRSKLFFRVAATKKKSNSNEFLAAILLFISVLIELVKVLAAILMDT